MAHAVSESADKRTQQRLRLPAQLPGILDELLALESEAIYAVDFSERLRREKEKLEQRIAGMEEVAQ